MQCKNVPSSFSQSESGSPGRVILHGIFSGGLSCVLLPDGETEGQKLPEIPRS